MTETDVLVNLYLDDLVSNRWGFKKNSLLQEVQINIKWFFTFNVDLILKALFPESSAVADGLGFGNM